MCPHSWAHDSRITEQGLLGSIQGTVRRGKNPVISASEGTRQSPIEKREGEWRDEAQGKIES